jgi:hypothetical protein
VPGQAEGRSGTETVNEADKLAEKLLKPKPPEPKYSEIAAALEKRRRAENEKTARLRALRLAKEAAEAIKEEDRNAAKPKRGRPRK